MTNFKIIKEYKILWAVTCRNFKIMSTAEKKIMCTERQGELRVFQVERTAHANVANQRYYKVFRELINLAWLKEQEECSDRNRSQ